MSDYIVELRCAEAIAREAGQRIRTERRDGFLVDHKSENNPVTEVDVSIETFIKEQLHAMFPGDRIVGEELETEPGDGGTRAWYVDPIDGTLNFSRDLPMFCVSIALQVERESVVGVIYDPMRDELFSARRGAGARLDGEPIEVSDESNLDDAVLVTGFPRSLDEAEVDNLVHFTELTRASQGVRRLGSAALDLAYVAAGRLDGFWEYHLNPWDTAAGYLLVEEAGGTVTDAAGGAYSAHEASTLATTPHLHEELVERLADL
jgi:myo-inositol-1(or 4)-monophosphatase